MAPRYVEDPSGIPSHAERLQRTGLEYIQGVLSGELPAGQLGRTLDFQIVQAERGLVVLRGRPAFAHTNTFGGVHGGWYAALMDNCLGFAVVSGLARGQYHTTLDLSLNMIRAIPVGTEVTATGRLDHGGRSTAIARGEIRSTDGATLYAVGTTTCLIMGTPT